MSYPKSRYHNVEIVMNGPASFEMEWMDPFHYFCFISCLSEGHTITRFGLQSKTQNVSESSVYLSSRSSDICPESSPTLSKYPHNTTPCSRPTYVIYSYIVSYSTLCLSTYRRPSPSLSPSLSLSLSLSLYTVYI